MSFLSFLRKYGEKEDPLFADLPVETPPPDEGDIGSEMADPEDIHAHLEKNLGEEDING